MESRTNKEVNDEERSEAGIAATRLWREPQPERRNAWGDSGNGRVRMELEQLVQQADQATPKQPATAAAPAWGWLEPAG
jgi:hypothetical protein